MDFKQVTTDFQGLAQHLREGYRLPAMFEIMNLWSTEAVKPTSYVYAKEGALYLPSGEKHFVHDTHLLDDLNRSLSKHKRYDEISVNEEEISKLTRDSLRLPESSRTYEIKGKDIPSVLYSILGLDTNLLELTSSGVEEVRLQVAGRNYSPETKDKPFVRQGWIGLSERAGLTIGLDGYLQDYNHDFILIKE